MKVLIVDPDIVGSRFLNFVFQANGYDDIQLACTGREALEHTQNAEFGLIVTEIDLPDYHGADLCENLRKHNYCGPIIVVSENASVMDRVRAIDAGADDFMSKPIDLPEFLARIAAVCSRYDHEDHQALSRTLHVGDAELSVKDLRLTIAGRAPIHLTPTEWRLMECLMSNADVALSRETLVNRIWGFDVFGDSNRLDVYIRRLRRKIERDPTAPEYLITVRSVGYAYHSGHHAGDYRSVEIHKSDFGNSFVSETPAVRAELFEADFAVPLAQEEHALEELVS
jgi:two-component system, OmpR family, response regulator RegX3